MQIRPAQESDYERWLPLWKGYQAFYQVDIPLDVTRASWQRFLDPVEPMHCTVAESGGELVGLVHFIFHRSCWTRGDYVYLQDLFTAPEVRGRGVGRQLIEHVYARAAAAKAARVYWLTHESNDQAMILYDKVATRSGFIQYRKTMA